MSFDSEKLIRFMEKCSAWFFSQSLYILITPAYILFDFLIRHLPIKLQSNDSLPNALWYGLQEAERSELTFQLSVVGVFIIIWMATRYFKRRGNKSKGRECLEAIMTISNDSKVNCQKVAEITKRIEDVSRSSDEKYVKYFLEPLNHKIGEMVNSADKSYVIICECAETAKKYFENAKSTSNIQELYNKAKENQRTLNENERTLDLLADLVSNANSSVPKDNKHLFDTIGFYIMEHNLGSAHKILKISYNKQNNYVEAIVYDGIEEHKYHVFLTNYIEETKVVSLILSTSQHNNVDFYSFDVNIEKYNTEHTCIYIKKDRAHVENYSITVLDERIMGQVGRPLSELPITKEAFKEIVRAACKKKEFSK